jgi:hypothetical protein
MADAEQKLQIDDDWKSEAAAEKDRLARDTERDRPSASPMEVNFAAIVQWLAMQTMVGLGGMKGPDGNDIPPNMEIAKHYIDMLEVLDTKTAGNLEAEEKKLLDTTLHQLRMAYVEMIRGQAPNPPGV